jgi:HTH-type transcriptional regulator, sugar sensing transcriptional regulator
MLNTNQRKEIAEVLGRFGLKAQEQNVYLSLLRLGQSSLSPIARDTRLPLTTVQSIVERLLARQLLNVTLRKSRHLYEAVDPQGLVRIAEHQKNELSTIAPLLESLLHQGGNQARIKVYYNDQMNEIFHEALQAKQKTIYEIVAAKELQDILGERFHFTRKRVAKLINLKSLRIESREIKKYSKRSHVKELRESRFLPKQLTFATSMLVWDQTVAFFTTEGEGLAWTVTSNALTETIMQIFNLLWELSRPMITSTDEN